MTKESAAKNAPKAAASRERKGVRSEKTRVEGMIVPLVTPLAEDYAVDVPALRSLCEIQIEAGTDVFFALGTTGEYYGLASDQRREVVETIVETVAGRVPILIGVCGDSTVASLKALDDYRHVRAAGYVASAPYFMDYSQEELLDHFRAIAEAAGQPIVLYNLPARYRHCLEPDTVGQLLSEKCVVGIKDSSGDKLYLRQMLDLKRPFPSFRVFEGALPSLPETCRWGIDGSVMAFANLLPGEFAGFWQSVRAVDWTQAEKRVSRLVDFFQEVQSLGREVAVLKACMALKGWCRPTLVQPGVPLGDETTARLRAALNSVCVEPVGNRASSRKQKGGSTG